MSRRAPTEHAQREATEMDPSERIGADCREPMARQSAPSASRDDSISMVLLGFVESERDRPFSLCAAAWAGEPTEPAGLQMFVIRDWKTRLPREMHSYFSELLEDWKDLIRTRPAILLALIREISVGPICTLEEMRLRKADVSEILQLRIGDTFNLSYSVRCI